MDWLTYLLSSALAGLAFYFVALGLLTVAFVADWFLQKPNNVLFLRTDRSLHLLQATFGLCIIAIIFAMDISIGTIAFLAVVQLLVATRSAQAASDPETFRPERIIILYRLMWLTIPVTFGAAVLADSERVGSWSEWIAKAVWSILPSF